MMVAWRWFLVALITAFLPVPETAGGPNVLVVCIDDLKPTLGCYGDAAARTPVIDRLAAEGVRFDAAYCNQAVCAPSRNALLTGLRPQTIGVYDLATNFRHGAADAITLGQHFQRHGYRTEALGKVFHTGHGNSDDAASWTVPHWRPKASIYALPENTAQIGPGRRGPPVELADVDDDDYADGQTAAEAIGRLEAAAKTPDQRWLLAVGFSKPHLPFTAPRRFWDLHDPTSLPLPSVSAPPVGAPDDAATEWGELRRYAGIPPQGPLNESTMRRLIHGYYAATSFVDAQVGRVLAALERLGLADDTIVVLWGDHGWHLGDHGFWCKHTNYEQAARIPLIVRSPGAARGGHACGLVETVDIYPTLAELAGLPPPVGIDGRSFAATVANTAIPARESVIHVYPRQDRLGRAIRTERHRLVEWRGFGADEATAEYELYDYAIDPLETRNRAGSSPDVLARLQAILAEHPDPRRPVRP
jgi:iduronate 2-sulfatase